MEKNHKDDFVEDLLNSLPKAKPMSKFETKRLEKLIDAEVAKAKSKQSAGNWTQRFTIAASVIIAVAGFAVFANDNEIVTRNPAPLSSPTPSSSPKENSNSSTTPSDEKATSAPSTPVSSAKPTSSGTQAGVYGNENPGENTSQGNIPSLNTGIDYLIQEKMARSKVTPKAKQGKLDLLTSSQISCAVNLGIRDELFAIDKAEYGGEAIQAFYYGTSDQNLKIKIVGYGCIEMADLQ
jgi:cytoskeletal protein RodZ